MNADDELMRFSCGCVFGSVGEAFVMRPCGDDCENYAKVLAMVQEKRKVTGEPLHHLYDPVYDLAPEGCCSCGIRIGLRNYGPEGKPICAPCGSTPKYVDLVEANMAAAMNAAAAVSGMDGVVIGPNGPEPMRPEDLHDPRIRIVHDGRGQ